MMANTQIYAAYFASTDFYNSKIPRQVLCGKGATRKKALFNILRTYATFGRDLSENARNKLASRLRRNIIQKEKKFSRTIFDIEEIVEKELREGNLKEIRKKLARELLYSGAVKTTEEANHFGRKMFNEYLDYIENN